MRILVFILAGIGAFTLLGGFIFAALTWRLTRQQKHDWHG